MKQIFIENFRIDIDRCEVHRENDIVSLEPKVLQVFLYLNEHQGEVVTHQALLDEIWPNIVVEANALQRCIGQLRKAFNDDAKQQRVIATYPKNGYSLLAQAHNTAPNFNQSSQALKRNIGITIGSLLLVSFLAFTFFSFNSNFNSENNNTEILTRETLNTNADFYTIYSPNGQYLAYPRQDEVNKQKQQLWLQDLISNEEFQLTVKPGFYTEAAWSLDSLEIAFVENSCLFESCLGKECSALKSLDISKTPTAANITKVLVECDDSLLQSPQWVNANTLVYIEKGEKADSLVSFNLSLNTQDQLYQQQGIRLQHLSYSSSVDTLAISIVDTNLQQQILLFSIADNEFTQINADYPETLQETGWHPIWNPQQNALLLSSADGLYTVHLDGQISKQNSPFIILENQ